MNTGSSYKKQTMICGMCGAGFDPAEHVACAGCPLQSGCQLVCCPACGYEMVDPQRSVLARLASRFFPAANRDVDTYPVQRSLPR